MPNFEKQIAPCVSTGREVSFEWSHHRISSTDSKVRVTLQTSIKYSGSERVKLLIIHYHAPKQKKITFKPSGRISTQIAVDTRTALAITYCTAVL